MEEKMTIFYSKTTGEIKATGSGIQDYDIFGNDEEDYKIIYEKMEVQKDEYVLKNTPQFKVNLDEKKIVLKDAANLNKYL